MPIVAAVVEVLAGRLAPAQALEQLMRREARPESNRIDPQTDPA
jgi:glycerol-3-phosphate dehydrogenase (NAD(P)+)